MASIRRLAKALHSRGLSSYRTLTSPLPPRNGNFGYHTHTFSSRSVPSTAIPAILAGLLGVGGLDVAFADSGEASPKVPLPSDSPPTPSYNHLEETAKKERRRLENLLRRKGVELDSYPRFNVAVKGQKVTIKFQVPSTCEIPLLIASLVSRLGVKLEDPSAASNMMLRAWDSGVGWQLALSRPQKKNKTVADQVGGKDTNPYEEELCIVIFRPLIRADKAEIEFMKPGSFTDEELDSLASVLQLAGQQKTVGSGRIPSADKTVATLESMGVKIFGISAPNSGNPKADIAWENIAGYSQQKREIEDTILLALQSPEVYDDIARGTRRKFESNRPRAVLFEGPPGTGKTSCARVIANQAGVPLLYVPLEIIMSKYYGESERLLGKVFSLANDLPNGAIVFLDEVDSFATARDGETHEATRRLLSVLLRQWTVILPVCMYTIVRDLWARCKLPHEAIALLRAGLPGGLGLKKIDGFEQEKKVVVVAATNRKQDLDPALISRFDSMITFPLPDQQTRQEIAVQYAKHLTDSELSEFARATEGMSGRDMRDVCQQAERHWASKIIRGQAPKDEGSGGSLPPLQEYIDSARNRQRALLDVEIQNRSINPAAKKPQFDFV